MLKKIARSYGQLFSSILQILFLLALCIICGAIVVFPLWKFATYSPSTYTFTFIALIAVLAIHFAVKKIKSIGARQALLFFAKLLVITGGFFLIFELVIFNFKILAIPVFILVIFLYGILSFKTRK